MSAYTEQQSPALYQGVTFHTKQLLQTSNFSSWSSCQQTT